MDFIWGLVWHSNFSFNFPFRNYFAKHIQVVFGAYYYYFSVLTATDN